MIQFDAIQKQGKESLDAVMASFGALSRGAQAAAAEAAEFAKRSAEQTSAATEKLSGARTVESAIQIQGEYVRTGYESLVTQASKMGALAATTAREAFAPVENLVAARTPKV
jgi:hypothetical protein